MIESKKIKNPFPGLRPFETDEYRLFFGREGQSDALIARLQRSHFLAVVGTSGSGKSSLVRAGLLPALRGGLMAGAGSGWRIAIMRPGNDPVGNLAQALADKETLLEAGGGLPPAEAEAVIEATLRRGSLGLVDAMRQARLNENEKLLVVVDQFEELFRFRAARTTSSTGDDASAFVKLLLEASQQHDLPIYVIPTMRSDFLGDCAQFQGLPEAINDGQYLIPRMTRDERRFAISGPVGVTRGKITEPLVNRLMNDVGDNPDQLPILQHALMRTWDYWAGHRRNGEPIGLEHYEAVGTMTDALSEHADEAFNELPSEGSRQIAELLFKALTERGADNREIRRPTCLRDICEIANASATDVTAVIDVFRGGGRSFLMPPAGVPLQADTVIDISHESLIRNWRRLKEWVKDEADSARIYRRLAGAAMDYQEGAGGLLDDVTLQYVLKWRDKTRPDRRWGERYHAEFERAMAYLEESRVASEARVTAEHERERRELETARAFAEKQARSAQRMRRLTGALCVILLLALGTTAYALHAKMDSKRSENQARIAQTAAQESEHQAKILATRLQDEKTQTQLLNDDLAAKKKDAENAVDAERKALEAQELETKRANDQTRIAADNLKEAEENARQVKGAVERGQLIRVGLESSRREDFEQARDAFQQLHDKLKSLQPGAPASSGPTFTPEQSKQFVNDFGWTLSHLGDTYHKLLKFDEAIKAYDQARVVLENVLKGEPAPILIETYHGLAHAYHDSAKLRSAPSRMIRDADWDKVTQEQFTNAELFYLKALDHEKRLAAQNPLVAVTSYKNLAQFYIDTGKFKEAEDNLKLVVDAYKTVEYRPGEGTFTALKEQAEFYRGQNRYDEAAKTYNDLIDLQEAGDFESGAELRNLADNYSELGQIYSAVEGKQQLADDTFLVVEKLQQLALKIKHKGNSVKASDADTTLDNDADALGDAYLKLGRFAEAKRSYETALFVRTEVDAKKDWRATSYRKLADLYREQYDDQDKAAEFYERLVEVTKDFDPNAAVSEQREQYVYGLRQLGLLYSSKEMQRAVEAEALFNRALVVLGPADARIAWKDTEAIYAGLLSLYGAQPNKERELEQTYERRLETLNELRKVMTSYGYRSQEYPLFMAAYYTAVGERLTSYLKQKNIARAESIYQLAFTERVPPFVGSLNDLKRLNEMAAALAESLPLLHEQKPDLAAQLELFIKEARAQQQVLETRQKELEELRRQQEQAQPKN